MLQHSWIAVIVFRGHDHEAIGALADCREFRVLDLLSGIVDWKIHVANIDQSSFDTFALLDFAEDEFRNVLAGSSFAHRAENYRNEEWSIVHWWSLAAQMLKPRKYA